jgi:hypothetical protein
LSPLFRPQKTEKKKTLFFLHVDMDGSHLSSNKKMVGREGGMGKEKKSGWGMGEREKKW